MPEGMFPAGPGPAAADTTGPATAADATGHAIAAVDTTGPAAAGPAAAALVAAQVLRERGLTVATAESLTGGLVAATLVQIPGISAVFRGGLVVYATELKHTLAGVDETLLKDRGAVDPDVARALARGARERCGADWGLATTGVAGPEPQDGKPVGLVYIAVAGPDTGQTRELRLTGDRPHLRDATVTAVLHLLTETLRSTSHR